MRSHPARRFTPVPRAARDKRPMIEAIESSMPVLQALGRGTAVYFLVVLVMRVLPKRGIGGNSPTDLLALVIAGGLVADAMSVGSEQPADYLMLVAVVLAWDWAINWLEFRFPLVARLTAEPPVVIVRNGRMLRRSMRRELITEEELMACLRKHGVGSLDDAERVTVESTGELSVIARSARGDGKGEGGSRPLA